MTNAALTPLDWANIEEGHEKPLRAIGVEARSSVLTIYTGADMVELEATDRHALAAVALHGQPFGFTHEDVAVLRQLIEYSQTAYFYPEKNYPEWRDRVVREGEALAERLRDLLPPRHGRTE